MHWSFACFRPASADERLHSGLLPGVQSMINRGRSKLPNPNKFLLNHIASVPMKPQ
jgi:hypothetical protein